MSLAQECCELIVLFEIMGHGAHKWCRMGSIWALDESPYEFHMGPKNEPHMGLDHLVNSRALKKHRNFSGLAMVFENKQSFFYEEHTFSMKICVVGVLAWSFKVWIAQAKIPM